MSTTTIRIEGDLKARVAAAAESAGKTTHAFMLDAIAQTVEQIEQDQAFNAIAEQRWSTMLETGKTVSWDATKDYLDARVRGQRPRKPTGRKLDQARTT